MYNEVKLYCKSEGITEYLRSEIRLNSEEENRHPEDACLHFAAACQYALGW